MEQSNLSYERFIEEAILNLKNGKTLRGVTIFSKRETWLNIEDEISNVNQSRKRWIINMIQTVQRDFFILNFKDNKEEESDNNFFIKIFPEMEYFTCIVYSYVNYNEFKKLKSFVNNISGMWLSWIGSRFLEEFDLFFNEIYPDLNVELIKFTSVSRDLKSKEKKGSTIDNEARTRAELNSIRQFRYKEFGELFYLNRAKFQISKSLTKFELTISDRTEFTLKGNGMFEFLNLYNEIVKESKNLRDSFTKRISLKRKERFVTEIKESIETISIDKIELIDIDMNNPAFDSWYKNLVNTFSIGYFEDYKIVSFVLESGNPYFLVEIIDLEYESRLFLSALQESIKISPSFETTKPSTISKLFSILQSQVDPTIEMSR